VFGSPTVAMAPTKTGKGYRLQLANGLVVPFGDAAAIGPVPVPPQPR
jgi:hypothetical protein